MLRSSYSFSSSSSYPRPDCTKKKKKKRQRVTARGVDDKVRRHDMICRAMLHAGCSLRHAPIVHCKSSPSQSLHPYRWQKHVCRQYTLGGGAASRREIHKIRYRQCGFMGAARRTAARLRFTAMHPSRLDRKVLRRGQCGMQTVLCAALSGGPGGQFPLSCLHCLFTGCQLTITFTGHCLFFFCLSVGLFPSLPSLSMMPACVS